jgi:hypothetical protein
VYSVQRTVVIHAKPAVKIQSASASPGIVIAPRAVVEVPMSDDGSTDSDDDTYVRTRGGLESLDDDEDDD